MENVNREMQANAMENVNREMQTDAMENVKCEVQTNVVEDIKRVIDELRPFLNMDGGDVEFIRYDEEDKTVYVRMIGACAMCMVQDETLENGLLQAIRDEVPEVLSIINSPL